MIMNIGRCLEILELESAESIDEVRKAYKLLVKVWHPDRFSHDSRLQRKAEEKIQQINAAYEQLVVFFTGKSYKVARRSITSDGFDSEAERQTQSGSAEPAATAATPGPIPQTIPAGRKTPRVTARKSHLGKYVFFTLLVGMAVLTALVLYFLSRIDKSVRDLPQMAFETIQEKMKDLENPVPPPVQKNNVPGKDATRPASAASGGQPEDTARAKTPCIIYLVGGDYILAEAWWYNEDMVEYRVRHGIVGIEKSRVKEIRCE
jgi:curved DNA-binding protein CbpA